MALGVVIAGGGISGLATALRLLEAEPGLDFQLLEASGRAGGTMGTETINGFVFERGPNGFLDNVSSSIDLARGLGLGERLLEASAAAKKRYLLKKGRLHAVPSSPMGLLKSPLLSLGGKLRMLVEPLKAPGQTASEESVAGFGRRRLGAEAASTFLDPLVTGVYAGDAERVSVEAAFPRIVALEREHGSLLRGMMARSKARRKAPDMPAGAPSQNAPVAPEKKPSAGLGTLHSFPGGLEELSAALVARLGPRLRLGSPVEEVRKVKDGFEIVLRDRSVLRSRAFVAALPAPRASTIVSSSYPDLAMALEEIPYAPVAVVCLGYQRSDVEHPLDGFGLLVPRDQGIRTLGAIFVSSIFPVHAPQGTVSLRLLVGGARDPDIVGWSADELEKLVVGEMRAVLGIRGEPVARRIYRYAQGIPQYNLGHAKRLRRIEGWLRQIPGCSVTGNAYRGVGMNDCVSDGTRVANEVLEYLHDLRGAA